MLDREFEELFAEQKKKAEKLDALDKRIDDLQDKVNHQDANLVDRDTPSL